MARDGSGGGHRRREAATGKPRRHLESVPGPAAGVEGTARRHRARRTGHHRRPQGAPRAGAAHRRPARFGSHRARRGTGRAGRGRLPGRGAAGPAHRHPTAPACHRRHRPRAARRARVPAAARRREDELTELLRDGPRRPPGRCSCSTTRPTPNRSTPLLPDTPDCLVVAVSEGPAHRYLRRPPLHPRRPRHQVRPRTARHASPGSVRITVDPRAAEALVEVCGGQPAALVLAGGWLAARPKSAVADLAKQLRTPTADERGGPAARPRLPARLRLAAAARRPDTATARPSPPRGLVDPHTASALAGCSVSAAPAPPWTTSPPWAC